MAYPEHDKTRFFKYTSARTAVAILESSSVRYSSPLLFNDPFDVQTGLSYSFDIETLPDQLFARVEELVTASEPPQFVDPNGPWPQSISFMRTKMASHGFPRDELRAGMLPRFAHLKDEFVRYHQEWQQSWLDLLPRLRVFSVAEDSDNLLMWAHYAEDHTGVVFELAVLPDEDNPLCVAQAVIYSQRTPSPFSQGELLDSIVGLKQLELDALCLNYARVKGSDWAYEKEWRVWDILLRREDKLFSAYSLRPKEVAAAYLGCRIDPEIKKTVLALLQTQYPDAKVYQARKRSDLFGLEFSPAT